MVAKISDRTRINYLEGEGREELNRDVDMTTINIFQFFDLQKRRNGKLNRPLFYNDPLSRLRKYLVSSSRVEIESRQFNGTVIHRFISYQLRRDLFPA